MAEKTWPRIARPGRKSVFAGSGCVWAEETQVELIENRQDRPRINFPRFRECQSGGDLGRTVRESPELGKNRYSMVQGVSVWVRHGSDRSRIGRTGRIPIFSDSGGVRAEKTRVELVENRQDRRNTDIRQFKGCQGSGDMGRSGRIPIFGSSGGVRAEETQVDQAEYRYSLIHGVSVQGRHR